MGMSEQLAMFAPGVPLPVRLRCNVTVEECDACRYYGLEHRWPLSDSGSEICLTDLWREWLWTIPPSWNVGPGHRGFCAWNGPNPFWKGRDEH